MSLPCLLNRNLQNPFSWKFHNSVIQSPKGADIHRHRTLDTLWFSESGCFPALWKMMCWKLRRDSLLKKHSRKVPQSTILYRTPPYCKELLRTKYYAVPRSIYYYTLESTTQYSQVFLHTTKYYSVLQSTTNASCVEKYNISPSGELPEIWPNAAPTTKSATPKSSNTTLVTKSNTPKSTNGARAVESDSPTSPNVAPATENVIVSFLDCYFTDPFLAGLLHFSTIAFLSWTYPLLYWVFLYWTFPWLNIPFWTVPFLNLPLMNYAFTALFYYRTIPLLN